MMPCQYLAWSASYASRYASSAICRWRRLRRRNLVQQVQLLVATSDAPERLGPFTLRGVGVGQDAVVDEARGRRVSSVNERLGELPPDRGVVETEAEQGVRNRLDVAVASDAAQQVEQLSSPRRAARRPRSTGGASRSAGRPRQRRPSRTRSWRPAERRVHAAPPSGVMATCRRTLEGALGVPAAGGGTSRCCASTCPRS